MGNLETTVRVEVVYALAHRQTIARVHAAAPLTARDAVERSGIPEQHPTIDLERLALGVFGEPVSLEHVLRDGDRVEIYRPLQMDPREARRRLAERGAVMGSVADPGETEGT